MAPVLSILRSSLATEDGRSSSATEDGKSAAPTLQYSAYGYRKVTVLSGIVLVD